MNICPTCQNDLVWRDLDGVPHWYCLSCQAAHGAVIAEPETTSIILQNPNGQRVTTYNVAMPDGEHDTGERVVMEAYWKDNGLFGFRRKAISEAEQG